MTFRFIDSLHDENLIQVPAIGLGLRVPLPPGPAMAPSRSSTVNAPASAAARTGIRRPRCSGC